MWGQTGEQALATLREALELYFEEPTATAVPHTGRVEVPPGAA